MKEEDREEDMKVKWRDAIVVALQGMGVTQDDATNGDWRQITEGD